MEEDLRMRTTLELRSYKLCMRVGKMKGLTEREQEERINMILDLYQLYNNNVINLLEGGKHRKEMGTEIPKEIQEEKKQENICEIQKDLLNLRC